MRTALFANGKKFNEFKFRKEDDFERLVVENYKMLFGDCLLYTSPSPRDLSTSRMPSSA